MLKLASHHTTRSSQLFGFVFATLSVCMCILLGLATLANAVPANPTNATIESTQEDVLAAREKQDRLAEDLEIAGEDYAEAQANLDAVQSDIRATDVELKEAQVELIAAQLQFENRAVTIYKNDSVSFLDVLMEASSFTDLVTRVQFMTQISQQDSELMQSIRIARAKIENTKLVLQEQEKEQKRLASDANAKRKKAERIYAEQTAYLNSLNAQLKQQIAQERARLEEQERLQAEAAAKRAREAAEAARREAERKAANPQGQKPDASDSENLGSSSSSVVSIARRYVGKTDYVWGGSTPAGFDCSGLTQYCYREIGITIPRNSRAQYQAGVAAGVVIPANRTDLLQPGDLLFFSKTGQPSGIHHVAIYSGNGRMIHAPQTGMKVSETSLWARTDFVGATRPK